MARGQFGGGVADFAVDLSSTSVRRMGNAAVNMFTAQTGGTHLTDLLDASSSAITFVTSNPDGSIPVFYGPDGVASMWADAGGAERVLLYAYNLLGTGTGAYVPLASTTPGSTAANGVAASHALMIPSSTNANANAITVKRADSTWGNGSPYGSGQAFEVLSPSTQTASDLTGDGVPGSNNNPVLYRVSRAGGIGTGAGIHVAPGIRNTYDGTVPTGIWAQLQMDTYALAVDLPSSAQAPSPIVPAIMVRKGGNKTVAVGPDGNLYAYASDGTSPLFSVNAGDGGVAGLRSVILTGSPSVVGLGLKAAASQSAAILAAYDSSNVMHAAIDANGNIVTKADNGTTNAAGIYSTDTATAGAGFRAIFSAVNAGVIPLGLKAATAQTAILAGFYDSTSLLKSSIGGAGAFGTYADDGSTLVGVLYPGTTPSSGARQILNAQSATTIGQYIKLAGSQSADAWEVANSGNTVLACVNAGGAFVSNAAAAGIVFKSPSGHFWRVTISDTGVLSQTDIGTTRPTT